MDLPNRRPCITTDVGEGLAVSVSYHPETNQALEVFVSSRGKKASDGPMSDALYNLGVQVSSIIQGKEHSTGIIEQFFSNERLQILQLSFDLLICIENIYI